VAGAARGGAGGRTSSRVNLSGDGDDMGQGGPPVRVKGAGTGAADAWAFGHRARHARNSMISNHLSCIMTRKRDIFSASPAAGVARAVVRGPGLVA
jgi:hypothetical protein